MKVIIKNPDGKENYSLDLIPGEPMIISEDNGVIYIGLSREDRLEKKIEAISEANTDMYSRILELEDKLKDAERIISMVQDNSKMPHKHGYYYLRLCCLSERANEYFEKYKTDE